MKAAIACRDQLSPAFRNWAFPYFFVQLALIHSEVAIFVLK